MGKELELQGGISVGKSSDAATVRFIDPALLPIAPAPGDRGEKVLRADKYFTVTAYNDGTLRTDILAKVKVKG